MTEPNHDPESLPAHSEFGKRDGVADALVRLLVSEWEAYQREPSRSRLIRFEKAFRAVQGQLLGIRTLLRARYAGPPAPPSRAETGSSAGRGAPGPAVPGRESSASGRRRADRPSRPPLPSSLDADTDVFPAFRDPRTGLFTQVGFDSMAGSELKRCRRHDRSFTIMLLHPTVRVPSELGKIAATLRGSLRESDPIGHRSNLSVAVALSEASPQAGPPIARRLIRSLERIGAWNASSRLGMASYPEHGDSLRRLLELAQAQLARPAADVLAAPHSEAD
ncbi:MAG: GGDEF domain-containing protein [Gemmatimonadota bacterium]